MCSGDDCLIYYFFLILIGFAVLIYFLLKYRASLQKEFLEITADQAWEDVANQAENLNLSKSNVLFGIWQDASATTMSLIVKDSKNQVVGKVFKPMGSREQTIIIGDQVFLIEFPLTWNRTAILHSPNGAGIIAKYARTNWFARYEYDLSGHGVVTSDWPGFNLKAVYNYKFNEKLVGKRQNISSAFEKGRILIFPSELPLEIRIFLLSV